MAFSLLDSGFFDNAVETDQLPCRWDIQSDEILVP